MKSQVIKTHKFKKQINFQGKSKDCCAIYKDHSNTRKFAISDRKIIRKRKFLRKMNGQLTNGEIKRIIIKVILGKYKKTLSNKINKKSLETEECKGALKPQEQKQLYYEVKNPDVKKSRCGKLTEWIEVFFLGNKNHPEKDSCAICLCDCFDDDCSIISPKDFKGIKNGTLKNKSSNVIRFSKCSEHFYHKGCAEALMGSKEFVKCAVCFFTYGEYIGEMPSGTMNWEFFPSGQCPLSSFEKYGTWIISYSHYKLLYHFPHGYKNGVPYRGTSRAAYLPDTKEGKEVLILLIKCFKKRHTFIVGDSVTTGAKNVVVWNSVHHKTGTHGGSTCFAYPDATYFNRVKLELADKGIVLEEGDKIDKIKLKGFVEIKLK